ncbi:GntR family transcriptional regulator [Paeniglutamicibacter cryotolerans]|uniref:DNA-binding transcriptional regulator YhcF (GntR family) n=1 Tax=Paeniglutamicibacter cryotolerans TaxID=670079 RepID=A0A839QP47_9MICC|nr:GntR family transcriptional regulator [Paeniglutamicibacter cryotolerans]MBB2996415.1 DNA-binding transcriptional regulator YhcF (GntR family) [Paeniglutamicibacter cryotolerans]
MQVLEDSTPIFQQIASLIENDIVEGMLAEETQAPSSNEFASFYRINPATAAKGLNLLVDDGILYKRRGIGMFVAPGARERLLARRREEFILRYVTPAAIEARKLGIGTEQLTAMFKASGSTTESTTGA